LKDSKTLLRKCPDLHSAVFNKSTAVAETGDGGHNRHGPKRGGGCRVPFAESWNRV